MERVISKCYYCPKSDHKQSTCSQFIESSVSDRSKLVRSKWLCFKCFSSNHRTFRCKRERTLCRSGMQGAFNHTLLHIQSKDAPLAPNSAVVASSCVSTNSVFSVKTEGVYLCIVPVRVRHRDKEAKTYAFLDQGSTHTFCDRKLIESLDVTKNTNKLKVQLI